MRYIYINKSHRYVALIIVTVVNPFNHSTSSQGGTLPNVFCDHTTEAPFTFLQFRSFVESITDLSLQI